MSDGRNAGGLLMAAYWYVARDPAGSRRQGELEAGSLQEAAQKIRDRGWFVARLRRKRELHFCLQRRQHGSLQQRMFFCRQTAVLLQAGMQLSDSLRIIAGKADDGDVKHVWLQRVYEALQMGQSLTEALRVSGYFPESMLQMILAGEQSGRLERVLERLADTIEKNYRTEEKLKTAMAYPAFLLVAALSVCCFVLYFVLPTFVSLFANLDVPLPFLTRLLLMGSQVILTKGWLLLLFGGTFLGLLYWCYHRAACRLYADRMFLQMPLIGSLQKYLELMKLTDTLAMLWSSGILLDEGLRIVRGVSSNRYLQQIMDVLQADVQKGYMMSVVLRRYGIFPDVFLELLLVGETVGELDTMLERIAAYCQFEAEMQAERLQALLEPCMILLIGAMVGGLVLAIVLPMLETITLFS